MKENRIELVFGKADTRLAGNPYGRSVYKEQVEGKIDYSAKNVICFPQNIEKIASSFVQGFFAEIVEQVGFDRVQDVIRVTASTDQIVENVWKDLLC